LYPGLNVVSVPKETRDRLAEALGEAGVEAEFFLALPQGIGGPGLYPHARGEAFLLRLEAAGRRLHHAGAAVEVAAQGYMTALEIAYPHLRDDAQSEDAWWPPFAGYALPGEAIELRLRRCGYAYRHVVAAHLAVTLDALAEQLALLLHALAALPPAGVAPTSALYAGLYELSSGLQGYAIPRHVLSTDERALGLLPGIRRLRALDAREDTALAADIAWARAQYAYARSAGGPMASGVSPRAQAQRWADSTLGEWQRVIADLESLQAEQMAGRRS
jgi:hypothetical protein